VEAEGEEGVVDAGSWEMFLGYAVWYAIGWRELLSSVQEFFATQAEYNIDSNRNSSFSKT
jgi:hypothetical protein